MIPFARILLARLFPALALIVGCSTAANAHPHVFVTAKSEIVYASDGSITGIRHAWTFDDMYSAYATQGIETKQKGVFTREDLAALAEVNVTSLKEYNYFTQMKADGGDAQFADASDYWLEMKDSMLTLHFTVPMKAPVKAKAVDLEIYDPSYFVDFGFDDKDPVMLAGAPAQCKLDIAKPADAAPSITQRLSEAFFNSSAANNIGAQFSRKISVKCP